MRKSKRSERTISKAFKVSEKERELLKEETVKRGSNSMIDLIFDVLNENDTLKISLEERNYKLINKAVERQNQEIEIIKACIRHMMGEKEFKKVLAKRYKGYYD